MLTHMGTTCTGHFWRLEAVWASVLRIRMNMLTVASVAQHVSAQGGLPATLRGAAAVAAFSADRYMLPE